MVGDFRERALIFFGDPDGPIRQVIRTTMASENYRNVEDFGQVPPLRDSIRNLNPDLIIVDTLLPEGDPIQLVADIRSGKLGRNPFVPIITTTWEPDQMTVRRIVDSGTDDLLVKPLSPAKIMSRIEHLIDRRKPFVVTSDYIGPDRRQDIDRKNDVPHFDVPNTLQMAVKGMDYDQDEVDMMVESAMVEINAQRLRRHSYQIEFLVRLIIPAVKSGEVTDDTAAQIERLCLIGEDMERRSDDEQFENVVELIQSFREVAQRVQAKLPTPDTMDLELLTQVSQAMLLAFNPDLTSDSAVAEISEMVRKFANRATASELRRQHV
jgi:DNA-binding response OmpR family regulator